MKKSKTSDHQKALPCVDTALMFFPHGAEAEKDICLQIEDSLFQLERDLGRFCFVLKELRENF